MLSHLLRTGGIALAVGAAVTASAGPTHPTGATAGPSQESLQRRLDRANLRFVSNMGQWDSRAHFLAQSKNLSVWLAKDGVIYDQRGAEKDGVAQAHSVRMRFVGSRGLTSVGLKDQSGAIDFMKGFDSKAIRTQGFAEVLTSGVANGVTMRTYFDKSTPRFDLIVAPNADPKAIRLAFDGPTSVAASGDTLTLNTTIGAIKQSNLIAYQVKDGKRVRVPAKFVKNAAGEVTFALGAYDRAKELVIDPLIYGSYYGGNGGADMVHGVVADNGGGVYLTGYTESRQFPNIFGPYGFELRGARDAFVTKLQGDAYNHDYSAYFGGSGFDQGQFAQLDPAGNLWIAGRTDSFDFPRTGRKVVKYIRLQSETRPNGNLRPFGEAQFVMTVGDQFRVFPFDVDPQEIDNFLSGVYGLAPDDLTVEIAAPESRGRDRWVYRLTARPGLNINYGLNSNRVQEGNAEVSQGLSATMAVRRPDGDDDPTNDIYGETVNGDFANQAFFSNVQDVVLRGSAPTSGTFRLGYRNPADGAFNITNAALPITASADQIRQAIEQLPGIGANNVAIGGAPGGFRVQFIGQLAGQNLRNLIVLPSLSPAGVTYGNRPQKDVFVMRWKKDSRIFLDPTQPTTTYFFGSEIDDDFLNGFAIQQIPNGNANTVFDMVFVGSAKRAIPEVGMDYVQGTTKGYFLRYRFQNGVLSQVPGTAKYMEAKEGNWTVARGVALDAFNNAYVGGTLFFRGNANTDPDDPNGTYRDIFETTAGVFENGRLIRNTDMFVRKYSPTGTMMYSAMVGGQGNDYMGGYVNEMQVDEEIQTGSAIAVDNTGNLYLTGVANSFNYPRTRNVYGEVFTDSPTTVVTKINADASQIIYSTNLRTRNVSNLPASSPFDPRYYPEFTNLIGDGASVKPAGIAIDSRGNAYISGTLRPTYIFAAPPPDPLAPSGQNVPSIPITNDALDPLYETPSAPEMATTEGFLTVLNSTGTNLIYSSYIGSDGDEYVMAPYVDSFGDVWTFGVTASRGYMIGTTFYSRSGSLPGALLSPTAFKPVGDQGAPSGFGHAFGAWADPSSPSTPPAIPQTMGVSEGRDGFIVKQRVAAPTVESLVLNPTTVPGGFGATSIATVTLSSPAPIGGAEVVFTLDNANTASFASDRALDTFTVSIPAGGTTASATVYTNGVSQNTPVQITANYQGSFKIAQLVVIPWLQGFTVNPSTVIGGNELVGRIVLSAPAPAGGVTVQLSTNDASLISFPEDTDRDGTIVIPAGQQTHSFRIATGGVTENTLRNVRVTILGVSITRDVTLTPASLLSIAFTPNRVPDGDTALGVIRFNGAVGADTDVTVTFPAGSGLQLNPADPNVVGGKVRLRKGQSQVSFGVLTPQVTTETLYTVTATIGANTVTTTLTVFPDPIKLIGFTLDPSTVVAGGSTNATVTISVDAPVGGVAIQIFTKDPADANRIIVESTVRIPQGQRSLTFPIGTTLSAVGKTVTLVASRSGGTQEADLTINPAQLGLTFLPGAVLGGTSSTGTVTISGVAPADGLVVNLTSNNPAVEVPDTVTIPAGESSVSFTATTNPVAATVTVNVTATLAGGTVTGQLTVRSTGLRAFTVNPTNLRPGRGATLRVTLESPAQVDTVVQITGEKALFSTFPDKITVRKGSTVGTATIIAKRFARPLTTRITATLGTSRSVTVNLIR